MRRGARGRCKPYTNEDRGSGATAADHETLHFAFQLRHRSVEGLAPRIDDNGPPWVHPIDITADGFAHPPPDAISHDGFADRPRDGEADLRTIRLRFADQESRKKGTRKLGSLVIDSSKVFGSQQTNTFWKTSYEDYLSELTVSLWRPRARRRESTARPFLVSIRERKPCVFAR